MLAKVKKPDAKRSEAIHPIPFECEAAAERWFAASLSSRGAPWLVVGRQLNVFRGPERLDLLALDENAVPWIFEFKRDIAQEDAIEQLLVYAAYIAPLSRVRFERLYAETHKKTSLAAAFKARFDRDLPEQLLGSVNLVVAAFDVSVRCRRVMGFLEKSAGLVIGHLKTRYVPGRRPPQSLIFELVRPPSPSKPVCDSIEDKRPEKYFLLSALESELRLTWDECRQGGLIALKNGQVQRHCLLRRGSGLFVYLRSRGLVGYGIVTKGGRQTEHLASPDSSKAESREIQCDRYWEAKVDWIKDYPWSDAVLPIEFHPVQSGLSQIRSPEQLLEYRTALGID